MAITKTQHNAFSQKHNKLKADTNFWTYCEREVILLYQRKLRNKNKNNLVKAIMVNNTKVLNKFHSISNQCSDPNDLMLEYSDRGGQLKFCIFKIVCTNMANNLLTIKWRMEWTYFTRSGIRNSYCLCTLWNWVWNLFLENSTQQPNKSRMNNIKVCKKYIYIPFI